MTYARPGGLRGQEDKAMDRLEKRYYQTMCILAWCHGKYTEEQLNRMTMPELCEVYNEIYAMRITEIETIRK